MRDDAEASSRSGTKNERGSACGRGRRSGAHPQGSVRPHADCASPLRRRGPADGRRAHQAITGGRSGWCDARRRPRTLVGGRSHRSGWRGRPSACRFRRPPACRSAAGTSGWTAARQGRRARRRSTPDLSAVASVRAIAVLRLHQRRSRMRTNAIELNAAGSASGLFGAKTG
jgi:hypothetical protein